MREEIGAKVVLSDGRKGICVDAYPDLKSGKGLELVIAIGAATTSQAESCDPANRVKVNSYDSRLLSIQKNHRKRGLHDEQQQAYCNLAAKSGLDHRTCRPSFCPGSASLRSMGT